MRSVSVSFKELSTPQSSLEDIFVDLVREIEINIEAARAVSTALDDVTVETDAEAGHRFSYACRRALGFIVFVLASSSHISLVYGVGGLWGVHRFIAPGLMITLLLTQSKPNAPFDIYFPHFTGTIYEHLSAPISPFEIVLDYRQCYGRISYAVISCTDRRKLFATLLVAHLVWITLFPSIDADQHSACSVSPLRLS